MLRILLTALALLLGTSSQAAHYKVFLLGGQSNMTGNGPKTSDLTEAQQAPQDDVWIYGGVDESASKLGPLQPGFGSPYGPEISFGRSIADGRPHENFALIKYSKGGTNLHTDWDPATGNMYNRLKTTVGFGLEALTKAGHTYEVVGMLWTQGERDAAHERTTAEYEADLNEFIADIRTRYGASVAFFISRLSILQTGREPGLHAIRAAQDKVAAADPNAYVIDTDSFDMGGDNLHFTGTGLVALGNAFGQAYLNSLPVDASAPEIDTLSPAHTAPAVEPTANLSITFDEAVVFGTGNIALRQAGGSLVESYDVAAPSTHLTLSGSTLTIDPSSLLAASTGYYIEIDATAIEDHTGNPFADISGDGIWSFTTSAGDASAPTLNALNPVNGANNVRINQKLSLAFSENIAFGSGNIELRLAAGGSLVASYDVASPPANLSISGGTLTIDPSSDLAPSTGYYLEIDATAIDDHAGNSFAGLDGSGAWAFTTAAPVIDGAAITATASRTDFNSNGTARGTPDKTVDGSGLSGGEHGTAVGTYGLAPTTIYNPVEYQWFQWDLGASRTLGSIQVWNFNLRSVDIYFSNAAVPGGIGSGNWTRLGDASVELAAPGSPNTGFDLATATGTTLPTTEVRHIRFEANTIWSGNGVALSEIQFSAGAAPEDETPPEIQTLSPANASNGVSISSDLTIRFNEAVAFGSGNITLRQSGGALVESFDVATSPAGLSLSGDTVTINPTADLALSTTYYVEIDDTAIDDLSGNSFSGFSGDGTWSFTSVSADSTPPTISSLNPTHTATGIGYSSNLVINFSENVAFGTGAIRLRRQSDDSVIESFNVASPPSNLTLSGTSVTLNPTADLAPATTYYVEIDATAIDDLAGNSFAGFSGDGTWSFTTFVPDTTLPTISTLNPANGATGVPVGANLTITFSEDIAFGSGEIRLLQSGGTLIESFDVATAPSGLTLSGATVTLNPSSNLALATTYYVEIDATAIDDLAGNGFAGISGDGTWSFTTTSSTTTATIVLVGTQYNMETKTNDPAVGWRRTTPEKTLDIDGDNVVGTDGYRTSNRGANPTYATATVVAPNTNSFSRIDDPNSTTADVQTGTLHDSNAGLGVETVPLLQFVITEAIPIGETLRVGVLIDGVGSANGTNSATYTLKQTVGGSATATTPALFYQDGGLDVTYFDLTSLSVGDTFVVTSTTNPANTEFSSAFEQVIGIAFDTGVISTPGETFADWIGGFSGLGGLTAFGDDPDGDGITNGVENYFGTHPGEFSQGLVSGTVTGNSMTFTHPLNDAPASNLSASYRWSKDLASFHGDGDEFEGSTVSFSQSAPVDGMVTATATITGTALDKLFVDIEVTEN